MLNMVGSVYSTGTLQNSMLDGYLFLQAIKLFDFFWLPFLSLDDAFN